MAPKERVADYPRPPRLEPCERHVRVEVFGRTLCDTRLSLRVLETFHPPSFYLPPESVDASLLEAVGGSSFCEWKGVARYFDLVPPADWPGSLVSALPGGLPRGRRRRAVWHYPQPTAAFAELAGWFALYPAQVDGCWLDGEPVQPQQGGFYGGWITDDLEGPFKGDPLHPELI
jgi:uncharacterized protein (DUF427 family)